MKTIIVLLVSFAIASLAIAAPNKPESVTAIWGVGSILVSWEATGASVVQIQKRLDGKKVQTYTLSMANLSVINASPVRNGWIDDSVAINEGGHSYRVRFILDGKKGAWSKEADEQGNPATEAMARRKPSAPAQPSPLQPSPIYPPTCPQLLGALPTPTGVSLAWSLSGPPFINARFDVLRTWSNGVGLSTTSTYNAIAPSSIFDGPTNTTLYTWVEPPAVALDGMTTYQVRVLNPLTGDLSPWSNPITMHQ